MQTFKYVAVDTKTGNKIKSELSAENEQSAVRLIKAEGMSPLDIKVKDESSAGLSRFFNKITAKDRVLFARQLSTLINAGLPLIQSLRSVLDQTQNKALVAIIGKVIIEVEAGGTLSNALAKHPKVFNQVFVNLVAAGETSGTLDTALERLAFQQEKDAEIMSKVKGAMAYPAIVVLVMVAVIGFMIVKVLPQVETIYKEMPGASLPITTRMLLALSHFVINYWWVILLVIAAIVFATSKWARTGSGKQVIDKIKIKFWLIGQLFMKLYMARFARTGSTLVASGVPLLQVLEVTSKSISNVHVEASIIKAIDKVKGGKALSDALEGDPNFLILVPKMLRIGEQSGSMEDMMAKVADYYEKEVDNQIRTISTIIEPMMMVVIGVAAFILVAAILLPIYGLAGQSGLGGGAL